MLIEALPAREGGCVLQFTVLEQEHKPQRHLTMKKSRTPIVYEFTSAQRLLDAAENVRRLNALPAESELYRQEHCYRLIVSSEESSDLLEIALSEFGAPCARGELPAAFTREQLRHSYLLVAAGITPKALRQEIRNQIEKAGLPEE